MLSFGGFSSDIELNGELSDERSGLARRMGLATPGCKKAKSQWPEDFPFKAVRKLRF
jgi:hypothetical protein